METKVPTAKVRWKESEVSRLFRAAKKEGVVVRVEIRPDGTLAAIPSVGSEPPNDLDAWISQKAPNARSA
jgi:hypothetical protein